MRVKKELVCFAQLDDISNDIRRINREDGLNPHPLCASLRISELCERWLMVTFQSSNLQAGKS